jgi:NADH-quinone oxidoreductase subunit F
MSFDKLEDLQKARDRGLASLYPAKPRIAVGAATCGQANGAVEVTLALLDAAEREGYDAEIVPVGCIGFCAAEPLVDVWRPGYPRVIYREITPEKARDLVAALARGEDKAEWALCRLEAENFILDGSTREYDVSRGDGDFRNVPPYADTPFFSRQLKVALRNCGFTRPTDLDEYIARGGFFGLYDVLRNKSPEEVIDMITKSGLRGRGGGGFPTGRKWAFCRAAEGDEKYVICNADEGDPGAYMDRSVLEGDPYSVLEGMTVGAFAVGNVRRGYMYVRREYPHAIEILTIAIDKLREAGLLGENVLGSGFGFDVTIARGAGAFVCGEETALLQSIEGARGMPRPRPPYPAEKGLFGKPTIINNVETWANVPAIVNRGADWFAGIGTEGSKGTKVFSLVGNVNNTGLVEVPMGISMHEVIFDIGGGVPRDREFKAVQTGGPSGGCLPATQLGLHIDFDALTAAGSMMGSGGMIVMDEHTCPVEMARYFLSFCKDESCGKCTPCRDGIPALLEILERITKGEGKEEDLATLESLGRMVKATSLCGLGQTAANPLLTTLRYFRDEYVAHIVEKRCPGAICKALISAPCHHVCPVGMDPPAYIGYIAQGQFDKAYDVITDASPFPGVCGRVCHYPCEAKCTSGDAGDPIAVRALKRFVADYARKSKDGRPKKTRAGKYDEKVAVIGSGPAGLSCAYELALRGYAVTAFEALPVAGGMLAVGIPAYRLPRDILAFEIENVKRAGVEIKTDTRVGQDVTLDELRGQGYKAFFVATGAHVGLKLGIEGEDAEGVVDAVEFLREVNLGRGRKPGDKVGVVGGGNAAIDAARTALRMGASEVHILYRRTRREMPAQREEIDAALEEGIHLHLLVAPKRVLAEGGRMVGVECLKMELGEVDSSGRRRPIPLEGSEFTLALDALVPAISQEPDLAWLEGGGAVETTKWKTVVADEKTLQTSTPDVFAGGDVVTGPWTVTGAIGQGKRAAETIHKYLRGEPLAPTYAPTRPTVEVPIYQMTEEELETIKARPEVPCRSAPERASDFDEVDICLSDAQAMNEAKRCLRCDASSTK